MRHILREQFAGEMSHDAHLPRTDAAPQRRAAELFSTSLFAICPHQACSAQGLDLVGYSPQSGTRHTWQTAKTLIENRFQGHNLIQQRTPS